MAGIYVDTSALGRVALGEPDAALIRAPLAEFDPWRASELLVVELRRLGTRRDQRHPPRARRQPGRIQSATSYRSHSVKPCV